MPDCATFLTTAHFGNWFFFRCNHVTRRQHIEIDTQMRGASMQDHVASELSSQLAAAGLLLSFDEREKRRREITLLGEELLEFLVQRLFGDPAQTNIEVVLQFDSADGRTSIGKALAFGAVVADLVGASRVPVGKEFTGVKRTCAIFNLGIGLVDHLCDEDKALGDVLMRILSADDMSRSAVEPPRRGWLRKQLGADVAGVASMGLAVDLIEVFFLQLHHLYPGERGIALRRSVGEQLVAALDAEKESAAWLIRPFDIRRLLEVSRATTVVPLRTIETLVCGSASTPGPVVSTLLGEALWRIDDLIDLAHDAHTGALNSVLIRMHPDRCSYDCTLAVRQVPKSSVIPQMSSEAVQYLAKALRLAKGAASSADSLAAALQLLWFVNDYVSTVAGPAS